MFSNLADGYNFKLSQRVLWTHHQHELVTKDGMGLQTCRLNGQRDDAHIDSAILQFLDNFVTEVAINTDLNAGIQMAVLGENVRQDIEASGFIGADDKRSARTGALIRYGKQRLIAHLQQAFGVSEQHSACGCEGYVFTGTIQQPVAVLLFQLADLGADRGLRAKDLLPGTRKTT